MTGYRNKKGWRASVSSMAMGAALGVALMVAQPALAVESTSALQGHVLDAPAGTKVTAVDTSTGAKVTVSVRDDGSYNVVGLRPGLYQVTFKSPDGKVVTQDVTLVIGETTELNGDMTQASQTVVVVGRKKEVRGSEVATSVSRTQIENLPQNGRNFMNFAALAPGVSVSVDPERKTFQGGATTANQVNVFIDGVSQKNQVLQGGVSGQDSSRGNPFPQLAVQEFKVSTQNFKAEYEQAGTAIITAVTKSGGRDFHGSAFYTLQTKDMIGQPYYQRSQPKGDYENTEYGFDVGGPIIKDKLHFYVAYEGRKDKRPTAAVNFADAGALDAYSTLQSALSKAYDGIYAKDFKQDMVFGKLTWYADDNNTVDFSFMDREEDDVRFDGGASAYERGSTLDQYVRQGSVQWKHRADNLLNEVSLDYITAHWMQSSLSTSPAITLVNGNDINSQVAWFGGAPYSQEKAQDSVTLKDTVTITGVEWHGSHVIKGGVKLANYKYLAIENDRSQSPEYFYNVSTYVFGGTNTPVAVKIADGDPRISSNNMQFGIFLQDDWTYDEHWAFNLGVRWDYESNMLNNEYVTPADIATALRTTAGFNVAFNPEDYISDGSNRDAFLGAFQPRLGFSYDVNGDRQTIIFGGFGRYYDRTIYDNAQLETRRAQIHVSTIYFPEVSGQSNTTNWDPSYFGQPSALVALAKSLGLKGEVFALNNDAKVPYSDQFNLGIRQKYNDINLSATFSIINSYNNFNFVLGNRLADGSWCVYGSQYACQPWGNGLPGYGNLIISTNDGEARYKALYLTAEKPYTKSSGYGYSATLTLTDAEATGHNDRFIFDYAMPSDSGWHGAEGVDKVRFVGSAIVDGPWDTRVSTLVTLASGAPFQSIDNTGPALRIIDGYYYPKNKLAYQQVDLRVSKDFTLPNGNEITVDAQVYNLFDHVNRTYSGWTGGYNGGSGASLAADNNTQGPARSFQVGVRYKW